MNKVLRQERKFLISATQRARFEGQLDALLHQDTHNGDLVQGGYRVRSLYFDTLSDRDFNAKIDGVEERRKMRLRVYHPQDKTAFLEMKQKQGSNQLKRSLPIRREDAVRLIAGDFSPLLKYKETFAAECYAILNREHYRPKTVVEYRRKAYVLPENSIRITLDSEIRANEFHYDIFDGELAMAPMLDPWKTILEVKYNHFLLTYVRDILRSCNQSELSASKYCMARRIGLRYTEFY